MTRAAAADAEKLKQREEKSQDPPPPPPPPREAKTAESAAPRLRTESMPSLDQVSNGRVGERLGNIGMSWEGGGVVYYE